MAMKETRHLTEVVAQIKAALPDTFYADLPIDKRVARMADEWRRALIACRDLEKDMRLRGDAMADISESPVSEAFARRLFLRAMMEERAAELFNCLLDGGSATLDMQTGELVLASAAMLRQMARPWRKGER